VNLSLRNNNCHKRSLTEVSANGVTNGVVAFKRIVTVLADTWNGTCFLCQKVIN